MSVEGSNGDREGVDDDVDDDVASVVLVVALACVRQEEEGGYDDADVSSLRMYSTHLSRSASVTLVTDSLSQRLRIGARLIDSTPVLGLSVPIGATKGSGDNEEEEEEEEEEEIEEEEEEEGEEEGAEEEDDGLADG